jgi:hypothetical protein
MTFQNSDGDKMTHKIDIEENERIKSGKLLR